MAGARLIASRESPVEGVAALGATDRAVNQLIGEPVSTFWAATTGGLHHTQEVRAGDRLLGRSGESALCHSIHSDGIGKVGVPCLQLNDWRRSVA